MYKTSFVILLGASVVLACGSDDDPREGDGGTAGSGMGGSGSSASGGSASSETGGAAGSGGTGATSPVGYSTEACERAGGYCALELTCPPGEMAEASTTCSPLSGDGRELTCCVPSGTSDAGVGETRACSSVTDCFPNEDCCPRAAMNVCVPVGTCIPGRCAAPGTRIETPSGERPIRELAPGDLVYSIDRGERRAVPLLQTRRVPVIGHAVARIVLQSGDVLEVSAGHPTADGRTLAELGPGDTLGLARVAGVSMVPYLEAYTYDILPASDSGTYFVHDALVGSTLFTGSASRSPR